MLWKKRRVNKVDGSYEASGREYFPKLIWSGSAPVKQKFEVRKKSAKLLPGKRVLTEE